MPLMPTWATRLADSLGYRAQQIGLSPDMPADQFEAALGRLLAFEGAMPLVQPCFYINGGLHASLSRDLAVDRWSQHAFGAVGEIRRGIAEYGRTSDGSDWQSTASSSRWDARALKPIRGARRTGAGARELCGTQWQKTFSWSTRFTALPTRQSTVDDLGHGDRFEALDPELDPVAGALDAAERDHRVHAAVGVDPDGSGLEPRGDITGT